MTEANLRNHGKGDTQRQGGFGETQLINEHHVNYFMFPFFNNGNIGFINKGFFVASVSLKSL